MSSCCNYEDGPDVFNEVLKKARKSHVCCECRSIINIGDEYQNITGLWDGHWSEYKTCEKCADLRESLEEVDCPYYGGLVNCFVEWLRTGPDTVLSVKPGTHAAKLVHRYMLTHSDGG